MSELNIFTIFDTKAKAYNRPFYMPTIGMAQRAIADHVQEEGTEINKHPEDYILFHIGEFDQNKGIIKAFDIPKALNNCLEFKVMSENDKDALIKDKESLKAMTGGTINE